MKSILFAASFFIISVTSAQVYINEYSCSNSGGPLDAFGQREDWVELYNSGGTAFDLSGYFLSDRT